MRDVLGNTLDLEQGQLHALRRAYRLGVDAAQVIPPELSRHLTEISLETNRQVGVLLDHEGQVEWVVAGDAGKLTLPDAGRARAGSRRLRGLRLVHMVVESRWPGRAGGGRGRRRAHRPPRRDRWRWSRG